MKTTTLVNREENRMAVIAINDRNEVIEIDVKPEEAALLVEALRLGCQELAS